MATYLPLLLIGTFSITLFAGCAKKAQSIACFKGSPACYTQQNINSHEVKCSTCVAVL
jgi:uncharacterized lipoprotein YajG